jgi:hypothetical protein
LAQFIQMNADNAVRLLDYQNLVREKYGEPGLLCVLMRPIFNYIKSFVLGMPSCESFYRQLVECSLR